MQCCHRWVQTFLYRIQKGQARKVRRGSCPVCKNVAGMHLALPEDGSGASKDLINIIEFAVGVCYQPDQEEIDEAFFRQLQESSHPQALVSMDNLNHSDNPAGCKQSRWFLECIDGNFQTQVLEDLKGRGTLLDSILVNKEEMVGDMRTRQS